MLKNVTVKDLSGKDSDVCVGKIIPLSALQGAGILRHTQTARELSLPWLTEHSSMTELKLSEIDDPSDFAIAQSQLPKTGYLVKLWCMWTLLDLDPTDIISMSEVVEHSTDDSDFVSEGFIYIESISNDVKINAIANEWASIQTKKHIELSRQIALLSDDEFIKESEDDGFTSRLRSLCH